MVRDQLVPQRLQDAHAELMAARYALAACQGMSERQAIDASDRRRGEWELSISRRLGVEGLSSLRASSERAFATVQVGRCAGAPGLSRLARAEAELVAALADAGIL